MTVQRRHRPFAFAPALALPALIIGCGSEGNSPSATRSPTALTAATSLGDSGSSSSIEERTPVLSPAELCQADVPDGYEFFNASATTVGELRSFEAGPGPVVMWPHAFSGVAQSSPAAWCRGVSAESSYVAYAATRGEHFLLLGYENGITSPPPPGPPTIE